MSRSSTVAISVAPVSTIAAVPAAEPELELSIVMPCLNEAETLETCIRKAQAYLSQSGIAGEIVIGDNGSRDGSPEIAARLGARVVAVEERGYGSALRGAVAAARGRFVIMGDSDDSYDFSRLDDFVAKLREGSDLVMGDRFRGGIRSGAMPWLHYWIGNPVLSALGRLFFRSPVGDFHCGLRGFSRSAFEAMDLRTNGMEFASEMVIKATVLGQRVDMVPVVLHPDGRSRPPHLRSWQDGWRHLRFMLLFSPRWLFLIPGIVLFALGGAMTLALSLGDITIPFRTAERPIGLGVHSLVAASLFCLVGYQLVVFAVFTKVFAVTERLHPMPPALDRLVQLITLETGLVCGAALLLAGLGALAVAFAGWARAGFGPLDPSHGMRLVVPAMLLSTLGIQTLFASFFLSILGLRRH
jgi:hypothetical protein